MTRLKNGLLFRRMAVALTVALLGFPVPQARAAGTFTYSQLEDVIRQHHPHSIDELLPLLPEDFRNSYVLVYNSLSLQGPDVYPEFPRIIFYSPDAQLVMAMSKGPGLGPAQKGPDNLETIEFEPQTSQFVFRELKFGPGVDPLNPPPPKNPDTCLSCHGNSPRPNWENYDMWPGIYGSISRLECSTFQSGTQEWSFYQKFLSKGANHGRYAFLGKGTPAQPKPACPDGSTGEFTFANGITTDPNATLGTALNSLNFQRIASIMRASPEFPRYKFLLAALGKSCDASIFESYFPRGFAKKHGFASYGQTWNDVIAHEQIRYQSRLNRFEDFNTASVTEPLRRPVNFMNPGDDDGFSDWQFEIPPIVRLKLIADRMGLDTNGWSMSFLTPDAYDINSSDRAYADTFFQLFSSDPTLSSLSCDELMQKSVAAFNAS